MMKVPWKRAIPALGRNSRSVLTPRSLELAFAACGLLAAAFVISNPGGPLSAIFIAAVWLVLPGWAGSRPLGVANPAVRVLISVLASVTVTALLSLIMIWTTLWYPQVVAVVILLAASAFLAFAPDPNRSRAIVRAPARALANLGLATWLPLAIGAIAVLLWVYGLSTTDVSDLGEWGLLPAFPPAWYLGVAIMLGVCLWGIAARRVFPAGHMASALAILIAMLYASANIIEKVPRLPWTYKHIAVTSLIDTFGRVDPGSDLYNRWPDFFATSAFVGRIAGYRDPIAYATWAELVFPLVDAAVVFGIARALTKNTRMSWTTALVFSVCNWVNQNYYSPQAFAFTLYLAMCLAIVTLLRGVPSPWFLTIENRIARLVGRLTKRRQVSAPAEPPSAAQWSLGEERHRRRLRVGTIVAILALQAIIAASHQLTPYLAVLGLLPLSIIGYIRPRWLGPGLLAIAILYLLPNFDYIQSTYGLFSGFDLFANATYTPAGAAPVTAAGQFGSRTATILSALTVVLAVAGWLRNLLRGNLRTTIIVVWLTAAPALALLGQTYGGEGRLRVFLFASPWLAIGVAWLFWSGPVLHRRRLIAGFSAALTAMTVLFTITYFQPEADHLVSQPDVRAAQWLDARTVRGDLAIESVANFPVFIGPNYRLFYFAPEASSLTTYLADRSSRITGIDVEDYVKELATPPPHTYLIFSDSQTKFAQTHKMLKVGVLAEAEAVIRDDAQFRLVYNNSAVRIYELR